MKARKSFQAHKEVKRLARLRVGTPRGVQRHQSRKHKPPKHKKLAAEQELSLP